MTSIGCLVSGYPCRGNERHTARRLCYPKFAMQFTLVRPASSLCVLSLFVALACDAQSNGARPYEFSVRISGDPGRAVAGAGLTYKGQQVAASDSSGLARLVARGQEGENVDFGVTCPDGYRSPISPLSLRLTRLRESTRIPEYQVTCAPALRDVVIAVRADNGGDLPVTYLGREVARTDAAGAAHFLLRVEPGAQLEVALDTHEKRWLRPQDPVAHFLTRGEDDVLVLEQPFVVTRDTRHVVVAKKRGPTVF